MGRLKRMLIIVSVVGIIALIGGIVIGRQFSAIPPVSDAGVQIVGGKHWVQETGKVYEINRMTNPATTTDGSTTPDVNLARYGLFTRKAFDYDLENGFFTDSEYLSPNIGLRYIYDTLPCEFDGTPREDFLWEEWEYDVVYPNGTVETVLLYQVPIKAKVVIDFTAHMEWERTWNPFQGYVVRTMHGEIIGPQWSAPGVGGDLHDIGGSSVKGAFAIQFWANKWIMEDFTDEEDYNYIKTGIIDVDCTYKQSYWHIRSEPSQWDILEFPPQKITYQPAGSGHYNWIETVFGDTTMYSTCDSALQLVDEPYNPSNFENIKLSDLIEETVYVSIPFDVGMGVDWDTVGNRVVKANSIRYVWKYEVELEFVYTVLTGYSSLLLKKDYPNIEEEEMYDDSLWERILKALGDMWNTTWGKIVFIGIFVILPASAIGIRKFAVYRGKKDDGKGIGKKKKTKKKGKKK